MPAAFLSGPVHAFVGWPPIGLCDLANGCETLVHDTPEGSYRLGLAIKKILEESGIVKRRRVGVPLTIVTVLSNPIARFASVEHLEEARWIEIGSTGVIQNSKFVAFDSYDDIRLPRCQISIPCIPPSQFDYHR